jgi:hypothetical protein
MIQLGHPGSFGVSFHLHFLKGLFMKLSTSVAAVTMLASLSWQAQAGVLCNYCALSTSAAAPTPFMLGVGSNIFNVLLSPTVNPTDSTRATADSRYFSFSVAADTRVTAINLDSFMFAKVGDVAVANGLAFFGIKAGTPISPSTTDPTVVNGYALLGNAPGFVNGVNATLVGQDLFPGLIASGAITGTVMSNYLSAGDYFVWLRDSRTQDDLSLNFEVAPEPAAAGLMGAALSLLAVGSRLRKQRA